jgi:hypothetical protein
MLCSNFREAFIETEGIKWELVKVSQTKLKKKVCDNVYGVYEKKTYIVLH